MPTERGAAARCARPVASALLVLLLLLMATRPFSAYAQQLATDVLRAERAAPIVTAADRPFALLLGLEASVVGFSIGPRAEFLWRPGAAGTVSNLRVHAGVLGGPEFVFVPIGVGYRAVFGSSGLVQPFAGGGYEAHFFITEGPLFAQLATIYVEGGCGFAVDERFSAGVATSLDWTFAGERGPGLQLRLFGGYRF